MEYQETGRFGRITKNLRKEGFENKMEEILYDSKDFTSLNKNDQTEYVETVMGRMVEIIGQIKTNDVLHACGKQCCGKSWTDFVKRIWERSNGSVDTFFMNLNTEEEKYNTAISYDSTNSSISVTRNKCICGLVNKGKPFKSNKSYCNCSIGHMSEFFNSIFLIKKISLSKSIMNGDKECQWILIINE